jgi:hypothetical protein
MANAVSYRTYTLRGDNNTSRNAVPLPVPDPNPVLIRGGADRPSGKSGFGVRADDLNGSPLWTAKGIVTPLSDEDYDRVKDHWLFKKHLEGGFLEVLGKDISSDHKAVAKVASGMNQEDPFKQLTKDTIGQRIKVKVPSKELSQE